MPRHGIARPPILAALALGALIAAIAILLPTFATGRIKAPPLRTRNPQLSTHNAPVPRFNILTTDDGFVDLADLNPGTPLVGATLAGCDWRGVTMTGVSLQRCNLRGADLRGARFRPSEIWRCGLGSSERRSQPCEFQNCDLRDADLRGADLRGSSFTDSDLTGALIEDCNLRDVFYNRATHWPYGLSAAAAGALLSPDLATDIRSDPAPARTWRVDYVRLPSGELAPRLSRRLAPNPHREVRIDR